MFDEALIERIAQARRQTLGDLLRRSAERTPEKTALIYGEMRQSYAELDSAVDRLTNGLAEGGVGKRDRVALLSHNNDEYVVATFALARLGAIAVPINFMLRANEVGYILDHAGATGVIVEAGLLPVAQDAVKFANAADSVRLRGVIGGTPEGDAEGWEPLRLLTSRSGGPRQTVLADDDVVQLMYTSGTESRPKGTIMTSRSLVAQYVSCVVEGRFARDDVALHALPLFHVAAQHCFLMPYLYLGGTNIVLNGPDPATILATVEAEQVSSLFCPPTVWIGLLRHPEFDSRNLTSLRKGYYGASVMPIEIIKELRDRLPTMDLFNFYGQTEMSAVALVLPPEDQLRKPGSAGRPAINVETILVDDDDQPVRPGVVGEIVHRSPQITAGYWNDPEKTDQAFASGWFHSGDLGVMDEDGYITVVDRKKDLIKTGGENVASREVEEVLYQHPAVAEVAVFGIPHPLWIEAVVAVVVARKGEEIDTEDLTQFCRSRLAGYKSPKYLVRVEALPKNASGKILKRELRRTYIGLAS